MAKTDGSTHPINVPYVFIFNDGNIASVQSLSVFPVAVATVNYVHESLRVIAGTASQVCILNRELNLQE